MGLDNGIVVQFNAEKINTYQQLPVRFFQLAESIYFKQREYKFNPETKQCEAIPIPPIIECEVVYWRRWWGVRNDVVLALGDKQNIDHYKFPITSVEQLNDIIAILKHFRNKEIWECEGQSVWEYEDNIEEQIDIDIYTLEEIQRLMKTDWIVQLIDDGVIEIYFYDSF